MAANDRTDSLLDLVFAGRNKAYGAYRLRRNYVRWLLISCCTATLVVALIALIPLAAAFLQDLDTDAGTIYVYEVQYIPFAAPDEIELVELARLHAVPPEEKLLVPVISDSVTPEQEKPPKPLPVKPPEPEPQPDDADTASYGTGGEERGRQANTDTSLATTIDVYPRYPGGVEARLLYLRRHTVYPKEAVDQGIQGAVMVVFVVEPDGSLTNITVSQGIGGGCDEEAIRVTRQMPRWSPGKRNGRAVRVMVRMPIVFRLPGK